MAKIQTLKIEVDADGIRKMINEQLELKVAPLLAAVERCASELRALDNDDTVVPHQQGWAVKKGHLTGESVIGSTSVIGSKY